MAAEVKNEDNEMFNKAMKKKGKRLFFKPLAWLFFLLFQPISHCYNRKCRGAVRQQHRPL